MKKNVWKSMGIALALACGMTVMSCGDDDPITPVTPDPDPEPEVVRTYTGYELTLQIDTLIGEEDAMKAFQAMLKDSIDASGLEFKEKEVDGAIWAYNYKITYNTADADEKSKGDATVEKCKQLAKFFASYGEQLESPVVTGVWEVRRTTVTDTDKDWQSGNSVSGGSYGFTAIPWLNKTTWAPIQAPEDNDIQTIGFSGLNMVKGMNGTLQITLIINEVEQEELTTHRSGNQVIAKDSEGKILYGFTIATDGKQIVLDQRDGEELAQEKQIVFEMVKAEE